MKCVFCLVITAVTMVALMLELIVILLFLPFHRFDQDLKTSLEVVDQNSSFGQMMVGQLYLHMAIFLLQNAKKVTIQTFNTFWILIKGKFIFYEIYIKNKLIVADFGSSHDIVSWSEILSFRMALLTQVPVLEHCCFMPADTGHLKVPHSQSHGVQEISFGTN